MTRKSILHVLCTLFVLAVFTACGGSGGGKGSGNTITGVDSSLVVGTLKLGDSTRMSDMCRAHAAGETVNFEVVHDMTSPSSATLTADLMGEGGSIIGAPGGGSEQIGTGLRTTMVHRPLRSSVSKEDVKGVTIEIRGAGQTARLEVPCP